MDTIQILNNLDLAISELLDKEKNILERGLNELNLNGHLTKYLTPYFEGYNVDPEYNGDIRKINDRKELTIAENRMREIGIDPNNKNSYTLTPDIIIHIRNTNENNLVVIEVKKDSNLVKNKKFDLLKLEHMTIDYNENHYNYKIGVAIVFGTKINAGTYSISFYQNGIPKQREELI